MSDISYGWAAFLGLLQGLTEFIPVSSSGHLALAQHLGHGAKESMAFDVLLHLATVLAVLGSFYKDIVSYIKVAAKRRVILLLVLATIPAGVVGLGFKDYFEAAGNYPVLICICLIFTGVMLLVCDRIEDNRKQLQELGWLGAFLIGCTQIFGMLPGVSRSGSTVCGGLLMRLEREAAVKFSFLMMVPAVVGANLLKVIKDPQEFANLPFGPVVLGFIVAAVSGILAIRWMLALVKNKKLKWFALYCFVAGVAGIVYFGLIR